MLVLERRPGETIVIGDDITVMVVRVRGDVVRIGVEAPKELRVDRLEIRERIDRERRADADDSPPAGPDDRRGGREVGGG